METNTLEKALLAMGRNTRRVQNELYVDMITCKTGIAGFNASTGIGKTIAYLAASCFAEPKQKTSVLIAVPTHQLARQVASDIAAMNAALNQNITYQIRLGIREYLSPDKVKKLQNDYLAYSKNDELMNALIEAATASDERNLFSEFIAEYDSLPDGMGRNDVCCDEKDKSSHFLAMDRQTEPDVDVLIISHATLLLSQAFNTIPDRFQCGQLIIDEADSIVSLAQSLFAKQVAVSTIERYSTLHKGLLKPASALLSLIECHDKEFVFLADGGVNIWYALCDLCEAALKHAPNHHFSEQLYRFCSLGIVQASLNNAGEKKVLLQLSRFAAKVISEKLHGFQRTWLLSGTLDVTKNKQNSMNWLEKKLGISDESIAFYGHYEPESYGALSFFLAGKVAPAPLHDGNIQPEFVAFCSEYVRAGMLVCTTSHEETQELAELIRQKHPALKVIEDGRGASLSTVVAQFVHNKNAVFVTPRASVGVNIRNPDGSQKITSVMITRLPYMPPPDDGDIAWRSGKSGISEIQLKSLEFADNTQKAVRRFLQMIGRAIRDETDKCDLFIMDRRMPTAGDSTARHKIFVESLPERYKAAYMTAKILTKKEKVEVFF